MYVFNQGKYKNWHAQTQGELAKIRQQVEQDQDFYPSYHIAPFTGLLNDPNGLIFDGEQYHIFYQWFPFDALHGMKHWQHLLTKDFRHFRQGDKLIPDEMFESHGCYSGGAILWQGQIVAFYTGNVRREGDNQRLPHQNIAIFDKLGRLIEKRPLLCQIPDGYTAHFRDPKPFITAEGNIRFVIGVQRADLTGTALLYEMENLTCVPRLLAELTITDFDNHHVFMWECPDLSQLGDWDLFIWSPQGKPQQIEQFQNNFHALYALGRLDGAKLHATHIEELDYGFDFYAPQTIHNANGVLFGWVGLPDLTYPTDRFKWHSMLSLPRQLSVKQGKLYQNPLVDVYASLIQRRSVWVEQATIIADLDTSYLQILPENRPLVLHFFSNPQGQKLVLRYQNGRLTLERHHSEQTDTMAKWGSERHCRLENLEQLEIFFDRSVVEIFVNGGEKVLTSRFFIANRENRLQVSRPIALQIAKIAPIVYQEGTDVGIAEI